MPVLAIMAPARRRVLRRRFGRGGRRTGAGWRRGAGLVGGLDSSATLVGLCCWLTRLKRHIGATRRARRCARFGLPQGATVADSPPRVGRRLREFSPLKERSAEPGARDCSLPGNGPIRTPSLEVVNVAGDSAVGRDRIQSAPDLGRVHAESAQQHRRRIWWLESEDLGQHLMGRDLGLPAVGPDRILKHFLCRGRHAEAIFFRDVSEPRLLRHGAHRQWGSVGAGPDAQGTQGFVIE